MTAKYEVSRVNGRKDQAEFLNLAWRIYKDDPNWVPPLLQSITELLNFKKHPFYDNATIENFLVRKDGLVVGRVSAIVNHGHNTRFEEKRGFFGFFECIDDPQAAKELFAVACKHLVKQGMTDVRGPCNPSLNYEVALLVEGFDTPPTIMMTYNPPYYEKLILACGFEKCEDCYAYESTVSKIASLDPKLAFVVNELRRRFNVKVRRFDLSKFTEEVNLFLDIYNKSLVSTWGFVPLSPAEVAHQAKGLRHLIVPDLTTVIEVDGKPIGSGLGLLDFNPVIKKIKGRLFPFGFIRLLMSKRKLTRVRLMSTNVLPEFQRWGFGLLALERMLPEVLKNGVITHGEFSWVLESNHLSRSSLERGGVERTKTYRFYDRSLADYATENS